MSPETTLPRFVVVHSPACCGEGSSPATRHDVESDTDVREKWPRFQSSSGVPSAVVSRMVTAVPNASRSAAKVSRLASVSVSALIFATPENDAPKVRVSRYDVCT